MQLQHYIQHPTPRVRRRAYHIHSEEREGTMEKVSFDNARRRDGADSDQCRPRGWHHQLQIVPPPLTPRTLAQQPVIAPTRAANNRGGRRDSELGKGAQLVPFPSLFSKFDNAVADRSHFHNWARCSFPAVPLCSETLLGRSAVLLPSLKHCGHGADTRPAIWNRGCVIPSMPP